MDVSFEQRSRDLVDWFLSGGGTLNKKIAVEDLRHRDAGRGVVAKQDISADETLFTIPRHLILTVENSALYQEHAERLKLREINPWHALILVMLYEYFRTEAGVPSPFSSYIRVWPDTASLDTLMFWDDSELAELQASAVVQKIGKSDADAALMENVVGAILAHQDIFVPAGISPDLSEPRLLALAHRMGTLIMAYAFDIESGGDSDSENEEEDNDASGAWEEEHDEFGRQKAAPKGMVPMADMLNADADRNNARLFYEGDALVMKSIAPIPAGAEIFNDYGPLPRSDLLRRYGYMTNNYAQYDVVEIPHDMVLRAAGVQNGKELERRLEYLDEHGVVDSGYDLSRPVPGEDLLEAVSMELLVLLATLAAPRDEFDRLKKKDKLPKVKEISPAAAAVLVRAIEERGKQYPTGIEEDEKVLAEIAQSPNLDQKTRRRKMAVEVRLGEKEILRDMHAALKEVERKMNGAAKRQAESGSDEGGKRARRA